MSQRRRSEKEGYNIEFSGSSLQDVMLQIQKFYILNHAMFEHALRRKAIVEDTKVVSLGAYKRNQRKSH